MKIAIAQLDAGISSIENRKSAITAAVKNAAERGARVTVLPELALSGYGAGQSIAEGAEGLDGTACHWLKRLAKETGSAVVCGLALRRDGVVFNSAVFAAPDGIQSSYDKVHLYGDYEKSLFSRGTALCPIVEFEGVKFGLLVCFDVEFPESVRELALRGADAVLVPTALPQSEIGAFISQNVVPVRAFENQVFVAYANHSGADERFHYQGQSCIAAPNGRFLAHAQQEGPSLLIADIDRNAFEDSRKQNPYLEEVRLSPLRNSV